MFDLDFSILPTIVRHSVFQGLPHFVEDPLSKLQLPETLDRLKSASWLLDEVSASMKEWQNRGFLRAGLSEFRSVAQALHWDLGRREVYAPEKSRNPLVHLVVRLRRVAVYLANAPTATQSVIAAITFGEQSTESEIEILLIADLERFLRADNLGGYRDEDISRRRCVRLGALPRVCRPSQPRTCLTSRARHVRRRMDDQVARSLGKCICGLDDTHPA
jgi:hypothetical protein